MFVVEIINSNRFFLESVTGSWYLPSLSFGLFVSDQWQ